MSSQQTCTVAFVMPLSIDGYRNVVGHQRPAMLLESGGRFDQALVLGYHSASRRRTAYQRDV